MRIRKRKVPLPLSLLSPIPLSDPHLFSRSPVMVMQASTCDDDTSNVTIHSQSQPSDHLTPTSPDTSASDLRRLIFLGNTTHTGVGEGVIPASNNEASITTTRSGATPTVDDDDDDINAGGWCDGDKAIPLKKRRGSFNNFIEDKNMTVTATTTTAATKKGVNDDDEASNNGNTNEVVVASSSAKKGTSKRGNTIMEGSRCSRVNGRGWRCCQPTLVGYSLCEHHLGKGRLRSMTSSSSSGSSSSKARTAPTNKKSSSSSNTTGSSRPLGRDERKRVDDNDADEKELEMKSSFGNNKKVKLGVVKARSLSSLLGQTMEHHEKVIDQL